MPEPTKRLKKFTRDFPAVALAYEEVGKAVHGAGPLDEKTRALIRLGISVGARLEGAVHSHIRKALEVGVTPDKLRHAVALALPTVGLPSVMAGLSWVDKTIEAARPLRKKR